MKKLLFYLLIISTLFTFTACDGEDIDAIIDEQINAPIAISGDIAYYASLSYEERLELCENKHIQITGIASRAGSITVYLGDKDKDGIEFNCSLENETKGLKAGDLITLHGVCTYVSQDSFSLSGCIVVVEDPNKPFDINAPLGSKDCHKKNSTEVKSIFTNAGFTNISFKSKFFEYGNPDYSCDEVIEVLINNTPIEKDKTYSSNDPIIIYYAYVPFAQEVIFGTYEQNGDSSSAEPITWYVLTTEGDKSLLISKDILDYMPFNDTTIATGTSWKNSTLRKWLNNDFYNTAFSSSEKKAIIQSAVQDYKSDRVLGDVTKDNVFILCYEQAWNYFPSNSDRDADLTTYAESRHRFSSATWWLIDSYSSDLYKYVVDTSGRHENSPRVNEDKGVRPAIWVKTSALK